MSTDSGPVLPHEIADGEISAAERSAGSAGSTPALRRPARHVTVAEALLGLPLLIGGVLAACTIMVEAADRGGGRVRPGASSGSGPSSCLPCWHSMSASS